MDLEKRVELVDLNFDWISLKINIPDWAAISSDEEKQRVDELIRYIFRPSLIETKREVSSSGGTEIWIDEKKGLFISKNQYWIVAQIQGTHFQKENSKKWLLKTLKRIREKVELKDVLITRFDVKADFHAKNNKREKEQVNSESFIDLKKGEIKGRTSGMRAISYREPGMLENSLTQTIMTATTLKLNMYNKEIETKSKKKGGEAYKNIFRLEAQIKKGWSKDFTSSFYFAKEEKHLLEIQEEAFKKVFSKIWIQEGKNKSKNWEITEKKIMDFFKK